MNERLLNAGRRVFGTLETLRQRIEPLSSRVLGPTVTNARAAKEAIDRGLDVDLANGLDLERVRFAALFGTEDQKSGMAAFVDKRPAQFTGR